MSNSRHDTSGNLEQRGINRPITADLLFLFFLFSPKRGSSGSAVVSLWSTWAVDINCNLSIGFGRGFARQSANGTSRLKYISGPIFHSSIIIVFGVWFWQSLHTR